LKKNSPMHLLNNNMQNLDKSEFTSHLIQSNLSIMHSFKEWIFYPGMLFNSRDKWWDSGKRDNPHEGMDLCYYKDRHDRICNLNRDTKIPAAFDGMIAGIIDDFLGKSIIIEHNTSGQIRSFCTIFGHVIPENGIAAGSLVKEGEVVASLSGTGKSKAKLLPHLHVSIGHRSKGSLHSELNWENISDPEIFTLMDPILLAGTGYQLLNNKKIN
jgi:hypothetical protein